MYAWLYLGNRNPFQGGMSVKPKLWSGETRFCQHNSLWKKRHVCLVSGSRFGHWWYNKSFDLPTTFLGGGLKYFLFSPPNPCNHQPVFDAWNETTQPRTKSMRSSWVTDLHVPSSQDQNSNSRIPTSDPIGSRKRTNMFFHIILGGKKQKTPILKEWKNTPPKINMEPENDGLEDDFSFSIGWFLGSMLIFRGVWVLRWDMKTWCLFLLLESN